MTTEAEKAAEEYYASLSMDAVMMIRESFRSNNLRDLLGNYIRQTWLAGYTFALTPRKIDWSKPATQPPLKTPVLCFVSNQKEKYWYVGFRENVGGDSVMRMTIWGNTAPMPDYYLPLPPTPQGER